MAILLDIGRRVELVSMDAHYEDISIGLYRRESADGPVAVVHSYSAKQGTGERLNYLARALTVLGGLEPGERDVEAHFPCRTWHAAAAKRLFLEACKHDPAKPLAPRPLETADPRSEQTIRVESLGKGTYRVHAIGATEETPSRAPAVAAGLAKLAELEPSDDPAVVGFPCGWAHDELLAVLLVRAMNLRAALREEEMSASRGVLVAPSAQE
jgi:hypothetical protein